MHASTVYLRPLTALLGAFLLAASTSYTPPLNALTYKETAQLCCITVAGYGITLGATAWAVHNAVDVYASSRAVLRNHPNKEHARGSLKQEILRLHDRSGHADKYSGSQYRNYPFVWYRHTLDWYITMFHIGGWLGVKNTPLLDDLYAIRDLIITDYDFIKEQRDFEK